MLENPGCVTPRADESGDSSFDYFLLVLQWPPGVATQKGMSASCNDDLTIHGLWPSREYRPETYPHDCSDRRFDIESIPFETMREMRKYWPSYKEGGTDQAFWEHEWEKHGTCARFPRIQDYFARTIAARASVLGEKRELLLQSFPPSHTKTYSLASIVAVLGGSSVAISCNEDHAIVEITYCLDTSNPLASRPCPSSVCHHRNCGEMVKLLPTPEKCSSWEPASGIALLVLGLVFVLIARRYHRLSATAAMDQASLL